MTSTLLQGVSDSLSFTQFTTPTLSSATPDSTSTSTGDDGGGSTGPSAGPSSLYLYTFLATLLLLLSVSGVIIFRSMVIRRRHRQAVLDAIANGTYVPPSPPTNGPRVVLGEKPKLYEVALTKDWYEHDEKWNSLTPFSTMLSSHRISKPDRPPSPLPLPEYPLLRFTNPFRRFPAPEKHVEESHKKAEESPLDNIPPDAEAQVAVLIAMPSPGRDHTRMPSASARERKQEKAVSISSIDTITMEKERAQLHDAELRAIGEEDEVLPVVEIGVAQVPVRRVDGSTPAADGV